VAPFADNDDVATMAALAGASSYSSFTVAKKRGDVVWYGEYLAS
jgi:hypothetical protein